MHELALGWIIIGGIYMGCGELMGSRPRWWIGFVLVLLISGLCF